MDPNAALKGLRDRIRRLLNPTTGSEEEQARVGAEACGFAEALDEWIEEGGFLPKVWADNCNGGLLKRAMLAKEVYETFSARAFPNGGRPEAVQNARATLLALIGNILSSADIRMTVHDHVGEAGIFRRLFPEGHGVWKYVRFEEKSPA